MDKVRFGRALGYGARHAARTLMSAAEAAAAPNPSAPPISSSAARPAARTTADAPSAARTAGSRIAAGMNARDTVAKHAKRSFLTPIKQFSRTVVQQVFGTVFALFALVIGTGVWRLRAGFAGPHNTPEAHRLYFGTAMFLLFAWFTVSSFVRASRAGRS